MSRDMWSWWGGAGGPLLLLALAVLTAAHYSDKRSDMSPMPFVMGSRYGRSSPPKMIAPRNDRFFMGSRYGKRSEVSGGGVSVTSAGGVRGELMCEFTGVYPLYRCVRRNRDNYIKRSSEEAEETGERVEE